MGLNIKALSSMMAGTKGQTFRLLCSTTSRSLVSARMGSIAILSVAVFVQIPASSETGSTNSNPTVGATTNPVESKSSSVSSAAATPYSANSGELNSGTTNSGVTNSGGANSGATNSELAPIPELGLLQSLEERLFNRTFPLDSNAERILRLEKFCFGEEGKGDNKQRLEKLKKVLALKSDSVQSDGAETQSGTSSTKQTTSSSAKSPPIDDKPKGVLATINQGIDNYNRHRFHNAEDDFNDAMNLAPGMSRIHVYLGVTLLQLNQRQSALEAMRSAYELDPFGTYGRYAKHCLIVLMGDDEVRRRGPKDNLKTVQNTINAVNKHADSDARRHSSTGQFLAQAKQVSANNFASRMNSSDTNYSNDTALKQSFVRMDGMVQAARARQEAAHRAASTQESANNLKSLITAKHLPGDAKLRAFGTTLNARYYGDDTFNLAPWYIPREMPLELKARAGLIRSAKSSSRSAQKYSTRKPNSRSVARKKSSSKRRNRR